ncbi:unnamed protein product [Ilex paraguariensis]|uniref:Uncharacterized protein n=1 Tax=Ilex paraguariensis TaxID=185542 RepID=A0ABC8SV43_9AQUA
MVLRSHIQRALREGSQCADVLANLGEQQPEKMIVLRETLNRVKNMLQADAASIAAGWSGVDSLVVEGGVFLVAVEVGRIKGVGHGAFED